MKNIIDAMLAKI